VHQNGFVFVVKLDARRLTLRERFAIRAA